MRQQGELVKEELPRRRLVSGVLIAKKHAEYLAGTLLLSFFFLLLLVVTTLLCRNAFYSNDAVLGLKLNGHIVGDFSSGQLQEKINTILDAKENSTIPLYVENTDIRSSVTLRELGEHANRQELYLQMLSAGRSGNIYEQIGTQQIAALGGWNIDTGHPNFDTTRAKKFMEHLAEEANVPATNARFVLENQRVLIRPDSRGRTVDVNAGIEHILRAKPEQGKLVTIPTRQTLPKVNTETLKLVLPLARDVSNRTLTVKAGSKTLQISKQQLVDALVVTPPPTPKFGQQIALPKLSFDKTKLAPLVNDLVKQASFEPTPTYMSSDQIIGQGTPGLTSRDREPVDTVVAAMSKQSGSQTVEIPMKSVAPPIIKNANSDLLMRKGTGPVYLTFDDGPGYHTEQILDILKRYNVHATFYVVGRNVPGNISTMRRIHQEGHAIGNHSYNHADLSRLTKAQVLQELSTTQLAIQQACGVTPTAFRPPYGAVNSTVREVAASLGLSVDLWNVDPDDWLQPGTNEIVRQVLGHDRAGSVVLLHILHTQTVDALPAIIEGIRAQGYTLE
jgi:peptidoglycan/xylan/chitin deacetylase (PgdA/CDA1 family)